MNRIDLVTKLPDLKWKEHSQQEITMTGEQLINASDFVWRVGNVVTAGFVYGSYTSPPWMWFVIADKVTISDLLDFRRLTTYIPRGTLTAVEADYVIGLRFAKFYGFVETGQEVTEFDKVYKIMRKR